MSAIPQPVQQVLDAQQQAMAQTISFSLARKQLDVAQLQGEAAVSLVESAAQLGKAIGAGGRFDAFA